MKRHVPWWYDLTKEETKNPWPGWKKPCRPGIESSMGRPMTPATRGATFLSTPG